MVCLKIATWQCTTASESPLKFKHGQSFWLECCVVDVWTPTAAVANTNFLLATNNIDMAQK